MCFDLSERIQACIAQLRHVGGCKHLSELRGSLMFNVMGFSAKAAEMKGFQLEDGSCNDICRW